MVELTIPFVNGGKSFVVGKLTLGILYDMAKVDAEMPEGQASELKKAVIMITGILKQVDASITEDIVMDSLDLSDFAEIMKQIMLANKDIFTGSDEDFQALNSLLKKEGKDE